MNKNKKIMIISIIALLIITIIVFIFICSNKNNSVVEKQETKFVVNEGLKFEINSEVSNKKFLEEKDGYKVIEEEKIDTSKLGENKYLLKLYKDDKQFEQEIIYIIEDTIEPIIEADLEVTLEQGQEFKIEDHAHATDNSNEEIYVTTEGEYDINKSGEYNLKYIAKDSSNNIAKIDFKLIIKEKPKTHNNNNTNNTQKPNNTNNTQKPNNTKPNSNQKPNNTKPNSNQKPNNSNNNSGNISYEEGMRIPDSQAIATWDRYNDEYGNKYSVTKPKTFSPEKYVTIRATDTPVKFHYEWIPFMKKWQFVDDSGDISDPENCQKVIPAPNRAGKEISYEENGETHYTGEKTQIYYLYGYWVEYNDGCHRYS